MAKVEAVSFEVVGTRVSFPLDMLRYDACFPSTQSDVSTIDSTFDPAIRIEARAANKEFKVLLEHRGFKGWFPSSSRWESFGWRVKEASVRRTPL
jgi:hypothetical protein